jgi:hypothetical protein
MMVNIPTTTEPSKQGRRYVQLSEEIIQISIGYLYREKFQWSKLIEIDDSP